MVNPPGASSPDTIPLARDGAGAPFIFFDGAPTFGINHGVAHLTLEALRYASVDGQVTVERVVVAELRTGAKGLEELKAAINGIELLASRVQSDVKN